MVPSGKRISLVVVYPVVAISRRKAAIIWRGLMAQDSVKQRLIKVLGETKAEDRIAVAEPESIPE